MAIKFNKENKEVKAHTSKSGKLCTVTIVIQIVLTISLGLLGLSPVLGMFGGLTLGLVTFFVALLLTCVTGGFIWISKGVRDFIGKAFQLAGKIIDGSGETLISTLKPYILAISLPLFFASTIGFIYNLIYFIKHDKANKGRFITSCVFLGLAVINLVICLVIFLTGAVSK